MPRHPLKFSKSFTVESFAQARGEENLAISRIVGMRNQESPKASANKGLVRKKMVRRAGVSVCLAPHLKPGMRRAARFGAILLCQLRSGVLVRRRKKFLLLTA